MKDYRKKEREMIKELRAKQKLDSSVQNNGEKRQ